VEKTDLPDWLQGLERPATTAAAGASAAADELPEWLRRSAASAQAEDALALAKEESAPVPEPPTATAPDEWVPAEEPVKVIYQAEPTTEPVSKQPDQQGIPAQAQDKDLELLSAAQSAFKENRLNDAIQAYLKLIKKGRLMDEVIHDLREANYSFPVDIIVWQTLGDAYMRANRLQEALDAYTEAEKLLR
jgi:tetratricopeptide (TPR) repeat protein